MKRSLFVLAFASMASAQDLQHQYVVPHFALNGGWGTTIVVTNPTTTHYVDCEINMHGGIDIRQLEPPTHLRNYTGDDNGYAFTLPPETSFVWRPQFVSADNLRTGWAELECDRPVEVGTIYMQFAPDGRVSGMASFPNVVPAEKAQIHAPDLYGMALALANAGERDTRCTIDSTLGDQTHFETTVSISARDNVVSLLRDLTQLPSGMSFWSRMGIECDDPVGMTSLYVRYSRVSQRPTHAFRAESRIMAA